MSDFSPGRPQDAYFVIRGYVYQVQLSIRRWLVLQKGEALELECGEDIDRLSQEINSSSDGSDAALRRERLLEQIKCHQDNVTLTSARMTLANFDAHRRKNAGQAIALRFRYTTNSTIGKESPLLLPSFREAAISVWQQLADGTIKSALVPVALGELKAALLKFGLPTDETSKPAKEAWDAFQDTIRHSDEAQLLAFVQAFEWSTGVDDPADLTAALKHEPKLARWARSDEEAVQAHQKLFLHVFELLSQKGPKRLTPEDLERCLKSDNSEQQAKSLVQIVDFLFDFRSYLEQRLDSLETNVRADVVATGATVIAHIDQSFEAQSQVSAVRQRLADVKELLRDGKWITAQSPLKLARQDATGFKNLATRNELMCQISGNEGVCKWHEDDMQAAQRLFEEALRYEPESAVALEHVAMMLVESDPAQARILTEQARLDPEVWPQASATRLRAIYQEEGWDGVMAQVQNDSSLKCDSRCAQALGEFALKEGFYDLALSYAETGIGDGKAPHALRLLADVLVAPIVNDNGDEQGGHHSSSPFVDAETGDWSELARQRMRRASDSLASALQLMQTWEIARWRVMAIAQRAAVFYQLGELALAEKEVERALTEDDTLQQSRFLKAILSAYNGSNVTAIALFDELRQSATDDQTRFQAALLGARLLVNEERWTDVVNWLDAVWQPVQGKRELIDVADCLLKAHHALQNSDEIREIQRQLEEIYASDPVAWAMLSQQAAREGKPRIALRRMEEAWRLAHHSRWPWDLKCRIARDLAGQHATRRHYKRGAILLAPVVDVSEPDEALSNFLVCLYHIGRNKQALEIASKARKDGRALFPISVVEAEISAAVGDFALAARLRREIQEEYPGNIRNAIDLAYLERQRGEVSAARQAVESIQFELISSKPRLLLDVAKARADFGLPDVLEYAYRARKLAMDNAEIHVGYVMLLNALGPKNAEDPLLNIEQVGEECAVHVEWRGKSDVLVITRHLITEFPDPHQIPLSDPRARALLGKRIGNRVQLRSRDGGQREDPHEIVAIQSKFIHALHETTDLFAQGVLQHEAFWVNHFEPGNPEEMLDQLRDFLRANHESSQFLRNFYHQQAAPLSTIARLRGRSLLDCWHGGFGDQFFVCEGSGEEIQAAHAVISAGHKQGEVALDETSILSVVHTKTEDVATAQWNKLLVPQIVRDEFELALRRAEDQENTLGWLYGDGDTMGLQQLTEEQCAADIEFWRRALKFIDEQTEVVPVYGLTRLNHGESEIYTRPTLAAALLAHERGCPLWSDDLRVRQWAKQSRKVPGFWTHALLVKNAESKRITTDRYFEALSQMILSGQCYLPIAGSFLVWACRRDQWQLTVEVQRLFSVVSLWILSEEVAAGITADFLWMLMQQPVSLAVKREFQKAILQALTKDRMAMRIFGLLKHILNQAKILQRGAFTSEFLRYQLNQNVDEFTAAIVKDQRRNMSQTQVVPTASTFSTNQTPGAQI